jgi:hypothetical protein
MILFISRETPVSISPLSPFKSSTLIPLPLHPQKQPPNLPQVVLDASVSVGAVSSTGPLTLAPFTPNAGSLKSESGYPVQVDAVFLHGSDLIRQDASGKHVRLDVNSVLKDKSGALIKFTYEGLININAETGAVLMGSPEAKTTGFGDASE